MQSDTVAPRTSASTSRTLTTPWRFYDKIQGDRTAQLEYLRAVLRTSHPAANSVLELACGTGELLRVLRSEYTVEGVDVSPAMLEIAARKLGSVPLHLADITTVALGRTFDVVLCAHDSLNHLERFGDWEAVFDRALEHLEPGGIFVFDMNTQSRLAELTASATVARWCGADDLVAFDVSRDDLSTVWSVRFFERVSPSAYTLHTREIREVSFPVADVRVSLERRFRSVRLIDPERSRPSSRTARAHFVCRARSVRR
ncbi:MAG TPA: class I SAM-dependent methyltransferase [Gaiellaceae bacterium]|nr:class I SAM-dependent methyltransferase [Gaiellaceae bacterium]